MHQTVQAFNRLMRALSFFRLFYEEFTLYQARLNRLAGFFSKLEQLEKHYHFDPVTYSNQLKLTNFGLKNSYGEIFLKNINITLNIGDSLLIKGASGTGKTSLLKAIAGIYPFENIRRNRKFPSQEKNYSYHNAPICHKVHFISHLLSKYSNISGASMPQQ